MKHSHWLLTYTLTWYTSIRKIHADTVFWTCPIMSNQTFSARQCNTPQCKQCMELFTERNKIKQCYLIMLSIVKIMYYQWWMNKWVWSIGEEIMTGKKGRILCPPKIPYWLGWGWTRAFTVWVQEITAQVMACPVYSVFGDRLISKKLLLSLCHI